jgi:outer membrane receptor protein involved in Fe transport
MRWFKFKRVAGTLALAAMVLAPTSLLAQIPARFELTVEDSGGAAIAGATVRDSAGKLRGHTDARGKLTIACAAPCGLRVSAAGFSEEILKLTRTTTVRLKPAGNSEQITVTAYRAPLGSLESPATTRMLSESALNSTAAVTMDGELRQLPGVELFRRSSSLVANPSSQGMSLRGLGSTSASRTLLTEDDVPLNDAFAGWIHWQEQPELSIERIELVRGGASDLYGSSAIGGVVNVFPVRPSSDMPVFELRSSYGAEGTYDDSLRAQAKHGPWGLLGSSGLIGTDGFIQEAPSQRGPVDTASNTRGRNGVLLAEHDGGALRLLVRGNAFNEARNNGTRYQTNGTRLWRYAAGADWHGPREGSLVTRLYGSTDHFRQTFSSISNLPIFGNAACSYRCGEIPSKFSLTPNNELGAVAHWNQPLTAGLLLIAGADTHDVRVWDQEQSYGSSTALTNLHDHQRDSAAYAEAMDVYKAWILTASARVDWFQNFDGHELLWNGSSWGPNPTQPTQGSQHFFDPRIGLSRKLGAHWAGSASGFRAFREPTPNELYRSTQVGNQLTKPNGSLLSERATGWEVGLASEYRWGSIRTSYFLTQVNRPITAVTTNSNSSPILLMRENLGQIESRGVSIDYELAPLRWLAVDGGYQYTRATVTKGSQDLGNWIPEVARNLATMNVRAFRSAVGTLSLQCRLSGHQFDDDANVSQLRGYFRLDAYASHDFGTRFQLFAAGENLLNRQIEVAKTPTTTLATPFVARAGILIRLGRGKR